MVDNPDVSSRSRPALRPRKARSKTGCLCCRLRKKKCDEKRPTCSGCTKLELICMWPDPKEFAWRIRLGLTSQTSSRRAPTTTSSPTEQPSSPARSAGATTSPLVSPKPPSPSPPLSVFNLDNDSSSWNLLQLYTEKTASLFLSPPEDFCDPFLFDVIPMAFGDPLVMDAVLSMGGFPLTTNERIDSIESQRMHHYGKALKGLKLSLTSWNEKRSEDPLRLLLTTVFLCQYEILRGNTQGVRGYHLAACRHFAQAVYISNTTVTTQSLAHVLLEMYVYMELSSSLHLSPNSDSMQEASESALESLFGLRLFPHFGTLLGSSAQLYEMIPKIRRLASDRAKELSLGIDCGCATIFNVLHEQLVAFDWGTALETGPASQMEAYLCGKAAAGKLVQKALVLFLLSAYSPNDPAPVRVMASPLVDSALEAARIISTSPWRNPVFWPTVVIASYACTDQQKEKVLELMWPRIALISRAREALQWLWESPDNLYGLDGLATVFKDHDANYCFG